MDIEKKYIAKAEMNETIEEHTVKVAENSLNLSKYAGYDDKLKAWCFIASLFHDLGKATKDFQHHLRKKEYKQKVPHNLVSFKIMAEFIEPVGLEHNDEVYWRATMKSVLLHHPFSEQWENWEDLYRQDITRGEDEFECIDDDDMDVLMRYADWAVEYNNAHNSIIKLKRVGESKYHEHTMICSEYVTPFTGECKREVNPLYLQISGSLKCADVFASKGETHIGKHYSLGHAFTFADFVCPPTYNKEIFEVQRNYAEAIACDKICKMHEINEPVGFGKTDALMMSALCIGKKIVFVEPMNSIAEDIYKSIKKFLQIYGFGEKVSVGLLLGNKWEAGEQLGDDNDIIVTNIDNYYRPVFKSDKRKRMAYDLTYRTVIFDEYHQYLCKQPLLAAFKVVVQARRKYGEAVTLFSSATKEKLFLTDDTYKVHPKTRKGCEKRKIKISYGGNEHKKSMEDTCIISNSVSVCQIKAEEYITFNGTCNAMVYHSDFLLKDKLEKVESLLATHGKGKTKPEERKKNVFATNIISTGIDVSFRNMYLPAMPIYEMYQSIGRCNRHGEYECGEVVIDLDIWSNISERMAIGTKYSVGLCRLEMALLKKYLPAGVYDCSELDEIFNKIMEDEQYKGEKRKYIRDCTHISEKALSAIKFMNALPKNEEGVEYISKKPNLRSSNDEGFLNLFVWCTEGMEYGEYINKSYLRENEIEDKYVKPMLDYLGSHGSIREKYEISKRRWDAVIKWSDRRLKEWFINMGRNSKTPFILTDRTHSYTREYGLRRKK